MTCERIYIYPKYYIKFLQKIANSIQFNQLYTYFQKPKNLFVITYKAYSYTVFSSARMELFMI